MTCDEVKDRGWSGVDVVVVTGDAYVDHPSFGAALIGRVLESRGYRVAVISMPDWRDAESVKVFGRPRLFFAITSGNVDSCLMRQTAFRKKRSNDPYAPGGEGGGKPKLATVVYANLARAAFPGVPVIIGGIEASMRRLPYFDFWDNRLRRSILLDSKADLLVYGMGERQVAEIALRLDARRGLSGIPGTVEIASSPPEGAVMLPSGESVLGGRGDFIEQYRALFRDGEKVLAQPTARRFLIHHPPPHMSADELDAVFALPFTRLPHPSYGKAAIPAFVMIRCSVTSHRGCVSGCSFCSLALHQGKRVISRSVDSILAEVETIASMPYFRGHITDIGGPSANMYGARCRRDWRCSRESCLFPKRCPNLEINAGQWIDAMDAAARVKGVKRVTVGSGVRFDLLDDTAAFERLVKDHVSGQLKIAPEHTAPGTLRAMRKAPVRPLAEFVQRFNEASARAGKRQYLVPYLMSCHPGCSESDMKRMRDDIGELFRFMPQQVQAFIPLPMTVSSVMYYTGVDPLTGEEFFVERTPAGRRRQHDAFFR